MNIEKAKKEGAEIIIAIDNSNYSFISNTFLRLYSLFRSKSFRDRVRNFLNHKQYQNDETQVLIIKPSIKLPISAWDNKQEHIIKTIQIGYNDVANKSTDIKELLFA